MEKTVTVYVRKGAHDQERYFSFRSPDDIPVKELLDKRLAIDGNQVLFAVTGIEEVDPSVGEKFGWRYEGPFAAEQGEYCPAASLPEALALAERNLVAWLEGYGYAVEFS